NPKELRTLVISGVGAGISATFNAPIGGAMFAVEILVRGGSVGVFIPITIASVVGTVVGQLLLGTNPAFVFPPLEYHDVTLIPLFIATGMIAGVAAAIWIRFFYKAEDIQEGLFKRIRIPSFLQPAVGGAFVGLILLIIYFVTGDNWETYTTMGRTYLPMDMVFSDILTAGSLTVVLTLLAILFILKVLSTVLSVGSGGSGGVFAPTLFLGVMLGAAIGVIGKNVLGFTSIQVAVFALIGMAAFFAGTGRAPLTAVIITAEMTGDYFLTIPLMFAVAFSFFIASHLEKNDIYILKLTRRGTVLEEPITDILDTIKVSEAMTPVEKLTIVQTKMRLEAVLDLIRTTGHSGFPVFDGDKFVNVITLSDVQKALQEHPKGWIVGDVVANKDKKLIICTDKDASLSHAVGIMVRREVSRLPIVEKGVDKPILIGWCTHHDITNLYMKKMASRALNDMEDHLLSY
ncbi:MAG: chloride channel protein, partial [Candidatus Hodarchaeales archaeon]